MDFVPADPAKALEPGRGNCHDGTMASSNAKLPRAGGALLAGAILIGVVAGSIAGQPSIGFLAGLGVGLALMAAVWLLDRR